MKLDATDFEIFGLPERYAQQQAEIDARWKALQSRAHPDRHAADGAAAQRAAMQWAVRVNQAHRRLKDPLARAAYLCELHGAPIDAHANTAMPPAFLIEQMQWREALDEAEDLAAIEVLAGEVAAREGAMLADLARLIDERADWSRAAEQVRALMFVVRLRGEIDRRLEALEQ